MDGPVAAALPGAVRGDPSPRAGGGPVKGRKHNSVEVNFQLLSRLAALIPILDAPVADRARVSSPDAMSVLAWWGWVVRVDHADVDSGSNSIEVIAIVPASVWFALRVPVLPVVLVALAPVPLLGSVGIAAFSGDANALFPFAPSRISEFLVVAADTSRDISLHDVVIIQERRVISPTPVENRPFTRAGSILETASGSKVGHHVLLVRNTFEAIVVPRIPVVLHGPTTQWLSIVSSVHSEARLANTPVALFGCMSIATRILCSTQVVHNATTVAFVRSALWPRTAHNPDHSTVVIAKAARGCTVRNVLD